MANEGYDGIIHVNQMLIYSNIRTSDWYRKKPARENTDPANVAVVKDVGNLEKNLSNVVGFDIKINELPASENPLGKNDWWTSCYGNVVCMNGARGYEQNRNSVLLERLKEIVKQIGIPKAIVVTNEAFKDKEYQEILNNYADELGVPFFPVSGEELL